jgi:DNA-binding LacI/PurR family transcriptional regulator
VTTPRAEGNVTLVTVARTVGVSPTTVSNAYNRPHKLSPALRERILRTARDLGYPGPNPAARSLRRGRAGSIGLLLGEALTYAFQDPAAVEFLRGLAEGTARHNTALQLIAALDAEGQEGAASLLANAIVDGLVVWSLPERHPLLRLARERSIPLVIHGGPRLRGVPFVGIDDRAAARAAAEHVLALGHRSIGVISHPFGPSRRARRRDPAKIGRPSYRVTRERLAGYRAAIDAAAPERPAPDVYEVAVNSRDEGRRAALALLAASPPPTAVLAMSDELALGALAAARELGLRVPDDVSVVGWDDGPSARASEPALTTVGQSLHEQGRTCAQLLITAARGEVAAGDLVHLAPWRLVTRESTAAPPTSKRSVSPPRPPPPPAPARGAAAPR